MAFNIKEKYAVQATLKTFLLSHQQKKVRFESLLTFRVKQHK